MLDSEKFANCTLLHRITDDDKHLFVIQSRLQCWWTVRLDFSMISLKKVINSEHTRKHRILNLFDYLVIQ